MGLLESLNNKNLWDYQIGKICFADAYSFTFRGCFSPELYPKLREEILKRNQVAVLVRNKKEGFFEVDLNVVGFDYDFPYPLFVKEIQIDDYDILIMDIINHKEAAFIKALDYLDCCKSLDFEIRSSMAVLEDVPEEVYCDRLIIGDEIQVVFHVKGFPFKRDLIKRLIDLRKELGVVQFFYLEHINGEPQIGFEVFNSLKRIYLWDFPGFEKKILKGIFSSLKEEIKKKECPVCQSFLKGKEEFSEEVLEKLITLLKVSGEINILEEKE